MDIDHTSSNGVAVASTAAAAAVPTAPRGAASAAATQHPKGGRRAQEEEEEEELGEEEEEEEDGEEEEEEYSDEASINSRDQPVNKRPKVEGEVSGSGAAPSGQQQQQAQAQESGAANGHGAGSSASSAASQRNGKKDKKIPRPMNSFMVFAKEYRKKLQVENPGMDNKEISKILGQKWTDLGKEGREIYVKRAQELAEEHRVQYPDWTFKRNTTRKKRRQQEMDMQMQAQMNMARSGPMASAGESSVQGPFGANPARNGGPQAVSTEYMRYAAPQAAPHQAFGAHMMHPYMHPGQGPAGPEQGDHSGKPPTYEAVHPYAGVTTAQLQQLQQLHLLQQLIMHQQALLREQSFGQPPPGYVPQADMGKRDAAPAVFPYPSQPMQAHYPPQQMAGYFVNSDGSAGAPSYGQHHVPSSSS